MTFPTHRDPLDDRIDRVASRLTNTKPRADLRERVLARLDEPPRRSIGPWTWAAAAAAAIVVAGAVIAVWPSHARPSDATTARVQSAPTAPAATPAPDAPATTTVAIERPAAHTNASSAERAFVSSVPALDPIDPLESITQDSIQPAKLSITQLTVNAIVMPAVDDDGSNQ